MPLSLTANVSGAIGAVAGALGAGAIAGAIGGALSGSSGGGLAFPPQGALGQDQPMVAHMFRVIIGADPLGAFTEVSNIAYEMTPYELIEGGRNYSPHFKPFNGPAKRSELTLKWGSVKRDKLQAWIESVHIGFPFKRNVTLIHMNRKGVPFRTYTLTFCWPKMWKGADMNTSSTEIATEELTLVYENLFMIANPMA